MNLTTLSEVLKTYYLPELQKTFNASTILYSRLEKDSSTWNAEGKNFTIGLQNAIRPGGALGFDELETLSDPEADSYKSCIVPAKYVYDRFEVSGQAIKSTKTDAGAYVRAVEAGIRNTTTSMLRGINRQFHGDGLDAFAYTTAADNVTPLSVDDNQGTGFTHFTAGPTFKMDVLDASAAYVVLNTGALNVTVNSVGAATTEIAFTGGTVAGTADGDALVWTGRKGKQMQGLRGIISAGDPPLGALQGLAVATEPWWKSQIVGDRTSPVDLSFANMQRVISLIAANSSVTEADIKFILCNYQVRDKYVELATNERFHFNTMTLDGGFEAVTYNSKAIVPDNQCDRRTMWFVTPDALRILRVSDIEWLDEDGSILHRLENKDAYRASLYHYGNLAATNRPALGALLGILD